MEGKRENLSSRLGFILLSAGCAIGIGNVYKFPIMAGYYGGGFFVLFYLFFLLILGIPLITMELAVGRSSKKSLAKAINVLEKPNHKWHIWKYVAIVSNYILMMCYIVIVGWLLIYLIKYINGSIIEYKTPAELESVFGGIATNTWKNIIATFSITIIGFLICGIGLKNGVEKVSKVLMVILFILIFAMVIYGLTLSGAKEALKFYLIPSVERLKNVGILNTISAAMSQSFFTLSIGIGCIAIFGSYIGKEKSLANEGIVIIILDTVVALFCGFIIFPACFTYTGGVNSDGSVGASFIFSTFSSIFNTIGGGLGRTLGIVFFLLLLFAAFSTVIAVFENIMGYWEDSTKLSRPKIALINAGILCVLIIPGILGNTIFSDFKILSYGIMDLEDAFISKLILPIGCLIYSLFCSYDFGWGFESYITEVNEGKGIKISRKLKPYFKYVLPFIILFILVLNFIF